MSTTNPSLAAQIGYRLSRIRKERNLTQADLASQIEVSRGYIADIEVGRTTPSRNFLESIVERFLVNAHWLLLGEGGRYREDVQAWNAYQAAVQEHFNWMSSSDDFKQEFPSHESEAPAQPPVIPEPASVEDHVFSAIEAFKTIEAEQVAATPKPKRASRATASQKEEESKARELDLERMQDCIQVLAELVEREQQVIRPDKFARACILLYELSRDSGGTPAAYQVKRLMEALV